MIVCVCVNVCPSAGNCVGPAWTPLFAIIGAVIMETGGCLSHGAVVAREFEIPAVSNINDATRVFTNGELVRVDGRHGTITKLDLP